MGFSSVRVLAHFYFWVRVRLTSRQIWVLVRFVLLLIRHVDRYESVRRGGWCVRWWVAMATACRSRITCRQLLESVTCYAVMPHKTCVVVVDSELPVCCENWVLHLAIRCHSICLALNLHGTNATFWIMSCRLGQVKCLTLSRERKDIGAENWHDWKKPMVRVTHDPISRSKGERSRSPGRLTPWPKISRLRYGRPTNFRLGIQLYWVPVIAGKAKAGVAQSDCGWTCGCAGKTVKSLENTCHTWALLLQLFTTKRRYIKCMHLFSQMEYDDPRLRHSWWPQKVEKAH